MFFHMFTDVVYENSRFPHTKLFKISVNLSFSYCIHMINGKVHCDLKLLYNAPTAQVCCRDVPP